MSLTTKQEHVTTTRALCIVHDIKKIWISIFHNETNNIDFALPRLGLASSLVCLASASRSLPLPCLASVKDIAALPRLCLDLSASASTKLPRAHPCLIMQHRIAHSNGDGGDQTVSYKTKTRSATSRLQHKRPRQDCFNGLRLVLS